MNRPQTDALTGEREAEDFNRNGSSEWLPEEPGADPYPFLRPELRAVSDFLATTHKNVFFAYSIHSGGGGHRPLAGKKQNEVREIREYSIHNEEVLSCQNKLSF
ncbi:MAG TPA: hypothetical protein VMZ49_10690 [Patescibacteria group bacterium]|nr:hypothetical protein [Patescibacteria group bacterium]